MSEVPFRKSRQQSLVDLMEWLHKQADSGKMLGACVTWMESDGTWHTVSMGRQVPESVSYHQLLSKELNGPPGSRNE